MLRFWSLSFLSAILFLAVAPVRAEDSPPPTQEQIDSLRRQVDGLQKRLSAVDAMEYRFGALQEEVQAMRKQLKDIQDTLQRIEQRREPSRAFTPENPRPMTGPVSVVNQTGFPATVRVNTVTYEVLPFQTRLLPQQPAGVLEFEVMAEPFGYLRGPTKRNLSPGEPWTVTIFNR
jgi:hypothetical protein